jgi:TPR repeat protein
MSETFTNQDMDLSSGIAAFESKQFSRAVGLLGPLAEAGDPQAQYRVAIMAQNGLGMLENPLQAFKYMRAAAEAGLGVAQHGLGFMYLGDDLRGGSRCREGPRGGPPLVSHGGLR